MKNKNNDYEDFFFDDDDWDYDLDWDFGELNDHKKRDKVKWVATAISLFFITVLLIGLCLQVFGNGKVKPSEWFVKEQKQTEQTKDEDKPVEQTALLSSVHTMSATVKDNDGIQLNASVEEYTDITRYERNYGGSSYSSVSSYDGWFVTTTWSGIYLNYTSYYSENVASSTVHYCERSTSLNNPASPSCVVDIVIPVAEFTAKHGGNALKVKSIRVSMSGIVWTQYNDYVVGRTSNMQFLDKPNKLDVYFELVKTVVPLPADPVKDGYTFVGWYYDSAFTRPYDGSPIYEDTQLYAKFEINRYTVTFDSNGGSAVNNVTVDWNTAVTLPTTTRDKYAFKGWFLPDGTQYTNQPIKENTTLTAQWERNVFNVTFDTDGGSAVNNTEVNLNATVTLPTTDRTGYTLKGWFLPDGTQYTNQPVTTDLSLTAQWEVIMCTVTFFVDGEKYDELTVKYGTALATITEQANAKNLQVMSMRASSGALITSFENAVVSDDMEVQAEVMTGADKVKNTVKNNKRAILGGVLGGVVLIALISIFAFGVKRKRRR